MGKQLQQYKKLFDSLKKGDIHNVYFLYGPEEFLKKEFVRELLQTALPDANRAFNLDIVYGDAFDQHLLDDRLHSFALFSDRRVVVLKNFKDLSTAEKDYVIGSVEALTPGVVFVVETPTEKLDSARLKNLKKVVDRKGLSFNFAFLDEQETIARVTSRFRREGFEVEAEALEILVSSVGTQLIDLGNEVDKIMLAAGSSKTIDAALVSDVVGKYRTEDLFSLLDLISRRNPAVLISRLNTLIDAGEEPVFILAMLLRRVLLLLQVKMLSDEKGSAVSSGRALADHMAGATSPFFAEVLRRQASGLESRDLERLLGNLRWADVKLKSTQLDKRCILEEALLAAHIGKTLAAPSL